MRFTRRVALLLTVGLLLSPSVVFAGGGGSGGTKRNSSLTVTNLSGKEVGFTTNANNPAITAALAAGSISEFEAAGGVILNAGASQTFSLQAGTYTVGAADLSSGVGATIAASEITEMITLNKGQSVHLYILATGATTGQTIEFSFTPTATTPAVK